MPAPIKAILDSFSHESLVRCMTSHLDALGDDPGIANEERMGRLYRFFAEEHGDKVYIRTKSFSEWQNALSYISAIPLQAYSQSMGRELVPYPHVSEVESYINRHGLNNIHLHLNLSVGAEKDWWWALFHPTDEFNERVDSTRLRQHLCVARTIRIILITLTFGDTDQELPIPIPRKPIEEWRPSDMDGSSIKGKFDLLYPNPHSAAELEIQWMGAAFKKIRQGGSVRLANLLYVYLVLLHEYRKDKTQSASETGFATFKERAHASTRFLKGTYYYETAFRNMHGNKEANSMTLSVDTRLAPHDNKNSLKAQLCEVMTGYLRYLMTLAGEESSYPPTLPLEDGHLLSRKINKYRETLASMGERFVMPAITFHFLKGKAKNPPDKIDYAPVPFFNEQRKKHLKQGRALTDLANIFEPQLGGIDAAGDELATPPDVFAPVFRMFRECETYKGHSVTCHAGECFHHLISGIRAVYDTITMLGLQSGDRIGHATALGISPERWLRKNRGEICLTKGEWLENLLFIWEQRHSLRHIRKRMLRKHIIKYATSIFRDIPECTPDQLVQMLRLRHISPLQLRIIYDTARKQMEQEKKSPASRNPEDVFAYACNMSDTLFELKSASPNEMRLALKEMHRHSHQILGLLFRWQFGVQEWQVRNKEVQIKANYLNTKRLLALQHLVCRKASAKGIVLETLPSSNLRILASYDRMQEHHSLRWLGVPSHTFSRDIRPHVALGDDDPGIFATDIKAEFYHLYTAMEASGMEKHAILPRLHKLNQTGLACLSSTAQGKKRRKIKVKYRNKLALRVVSW